MKRKITHTITLLCLCSLSCFAQKSGNRFYTIGEQAKHGNANERTLNLEDATDSVPSNTSMYEEMHKYAEDNTAAMDTSLSSSKGEPFGKRLSSTQQGGRELNISNLIDVFGEVGMSNKLFVLAQAVLETGHFQSRVCKQYNNLFGLYDSKKGDYFRFERWEDSVAGYKRMIQYRYKGGNYLYFLKRIGYAEDPRYISKVAKLAKDLYHQLFKE